LAPKHYEQLPKPFLKWAGGKGELVPIFDRCGLLPPQFSDYYEPFLGGGAMFFYLWKNGRITGDAHLNDVNRDIVDSYNIIIENLPELIEELEVLKMRKDEESFYEFRDEFNVLKNGDKWTPEKKIRKTALLLYLNKTCFNGLYRENSKSGFNVPYGKYANPKILDLRNLKKVSISLKDAIVTSGDYSEACDRVKEGDFVYFDPPYMPISETSNFTGYHASNFLLEDQEKLADLYQRLSEKGAFLLLSNAYHPEIKRLFESIEGIHLNVVMAKRSISCQGNSRQPVKEYAITNYPPRPAQALLF
jgi:DNA adenine methylase